MKYENLISYPRTMAKKMYDFMNVTNNIKYAYEYLHNHMEPQTDILLAKNLTKQALMMSFMKRKVRLETKWRTGVISRKEYDKALNDSAYKPKDDAEISKVRQYFLSTKVRFFKNVLDKIISPKKLQKLPSQLLLCT